MVELEVVIIWTELQTMPILVIRIRLSRAYTEINLEGGGAQFATPPLTGLGGTSPMPPPIGFWVLGYISENLKRMNHFKKLYKIKICMHKILDISSIMCIFWR